MSKIVIKIGTRLLTTSDGKLDLNNMRTIISQLIQIRKDHMVEFIIVSSGAITCGANKLHIEPSTISEKQASAAVGQFLLMKEYSTFFNNDGVHVGQILLTKDGIIDPQRNPHILTTISTLLSRQIIPIINENDSVSIDEIQFGDNDELSSYVATLIQAEQLIILTDTKGLYTKNPKHNPEAEHIKLVPHISEDILSFADTHEDEISRGGMKSKLLAAKHATKNNIKTIIADGRDPSVLYKIFEGKDVGTTFTP